MAAMTSHSNHQLQETSVTLNRVRMGRGVSGTARGWMDTDVNVHLISQEETAKVYKYLTKYYIYFSAVLAITISLEPVLKGNLHS